MIESVWKHVCPEATMNKPWNQVVSEILFSKNKISNEQPLTNMELIRSPRHSKRNLEEVEHIYQRKFKWKSNLPKQEMRRLCFHERTEAYYGKKD